MKKRFPYISIVIVGIVLFMAICGGYFAPYGKEEFIYSQAGQGPSAEHLLGTDSLGRDVFSMIIYGSRISMYIGILGAFVSTALAFVYGSLCGLAGRKIEQLLIRFLDILIAIPSIMLIIFLQGVMGSPNASSIAIAIGISGFMPMARMVASEVKQIRTSEYIVSAKLMGASYIYILFRHLIPNFIPPIMYMAVSSIGKAIISEATLSFIGIGLPVGESSWGSLMSISQGALLSNQWWIIVFPGLVMIVTLVAITQIGEYIRKNNTNINSNL